MLDEKSSEKQQILRHVLLFLAFFVTLTLMISLTNFAVNTNAQEE